MEIAKLLVETIENLKNIESDIKNAVYVPKEKSSATKKKSKKFQDFYQDFLFTMLQYPMSHHPASLYDFLQLLKKPIGDWGCFSKKDLQKENIDPEFYVLSETIGITQQATELLSEYESIREMDTLPVRLALISCRKKQKEELFGDYMQQVYESFRNFIIHNPTTNDDLIMKYSNEHGFDSEIENLLIRCYEMIPRGEHRKCQYCGWAMELRYEQAFCVRMECKEKYNPHSSTFKKIDPEHDKRTLRSIQLTTVIPGLREWDLCLLLKKHGIHYEQYPDLERKGDVYIYKTIAGKKKEIWVDVKDYVHASSLVRALEDDFENGRIKTNYIGIPTFRATKRYLQYINDKLAEIPGMKCRAYSFKQIANMFVDPNIEKKQVKEVIVVD